MPTIATAHPSGDKRFKVLDVTMKRHQHRPDSLIEVLHKAQELFGCLELDILFYVAWSLKLPPATASACASSARRSSRHSAAARFIPRGPSPAACAMQCRSKSVIT